MSMFPGMATFTWAGVEALVKSLRIEMQREFYHPNAILAIGRGGLVPARLLADTQRIYYLGCNSYSEENKQSLHLNIFQGIDKNTCHDMLDSPDTLILDDLWDTGLTMKTVGELFPQAKRAALLSKKEEHGLDFAGLVMPTSQWVEFPWE